MKKNYILIITFLATQLCLAQYEFSGQLNQTGPQQVFLSLVEDYRKINGIYTEQIIAVTTSDATGNFKFSGDNLDKQNRIYRIHIDNCSGAERELNHFSGHCDDSEAILFIANNNDVVVIPQTANRQIFCDLESTNSHTKCLLKIDNLIEEMKYDYATYRSEANRKLNNKRWFKKLQNFGESLNEPLAELYIYSFLSDKTLEMHKYYTEDLKTNSYYDALLKRLQYEYANTEYSKEYETELNADKYVLHLKDKEKSSNLLHYIVYAILALSLLLNVYMFLCKRKNKTIEEHDYLNQLSKQEQSILQLILEDYTNKEIAQQLFISVSTVKTHINNIYKKLKVQSREEVKTLLNNTLKN